MLHPSHTRGKSEDETLLQKMETQDATRGLHSWHCVEPHGLGITISVGDYLGYINSYRKTSPLWVVPSPSWNPGLYTWRKGTEKQCALIHLFFLM